jgi:hypothetical protein
MLRVGYCSGSDRFVDRRIARAVHPQRDFLSHAASVPVQKGRDHAYRTKHVAGPWPPPVHYTASPSYHPVSALSIPPRHTAAKILRPAGPKIVNPCL